MLQNHCINSEAAGNRSGMYGRMHRLVIALGRTAHKDAAGAIARKIRELRPDRETWDYRAVALAAGNLRDPSLAEPLAELLLEAGMTGQVITTLEQARREGGEREAGEGRTVRLINPAVRELGLARALYRCGDHRGMAGKILRHCQNDLRVHFARDAHETLKRE